MPGSAAALMAREWTRTENGDTVQRMLELRWASGDVLANGARRLGAVRAPGGRRCTSSGGAGERTIVVIPALWRLLWRATGLRYVWKFLFGSWLVKRIWGDERLKRDSSGRDQGHGR